MRSPISHLEEEFERLLSDYCTLIEAGREEEAEEASSMAESYLEVLGTLKLIRDMPFQEEEYDTETVQQLAGVEMGS